MEYPLTIISFLPYDIQSKYGHVLMLTVVVIIVFCIGLLTRKMTAEIPGKPQVAFEGLTRYLYNLGDSIMGPEGRIYMPFVIGIGFYVGVSNLLGLIPGFNPPTSNMNTTAAPAICVFMLYHYIGIRKHGVSYIKQFTGPIKPLIPLMIIIELIAHFARPLSLTMRLFGNITGEKTVIMILFMLVPFLVPLPMYFLALFLGLLQAFVFLMLTMVYIGGALEEAH
jgi:F-type H+-transporting ATPase subunit a